MYKLDVTCNFCWIDLILLAMFGNPEAPVPPKIELTRNIRTSSPPYASSTALYI